MHFRVETPMSQQHSDHAAPRGTRRRPSLAEQLAAFHAALLARMPPADAEAMRQSEHMLAAAGRTMLRAGDAAPDFTLPDQHGRPVRLADRLALGPVVVLFTRGGWCPFCTMVLRAWADALAALQDAGGDLLAIAPQPVPACGSVAERDLLAYPVLSDRDGGVAAAYGVDWELPEAVRPLLLRLGHDLPALNGDGRWRAPLPAVFVVGGDGRVILAHADRTAARRLDPAAVIAAVAASGTADAGQAGKNQAT
jgi:peroxiredoxin